VPASPEKPINHAVSADANDTDYEPITVKPIVDKSAALSMEGTIRDTIKTRRVAFLAANGVNDQSLNGMRKALEGGGATVKIVSLKQGTITTEGGKQIPVDGSFLGEASVCYDAVFIPDGKKSIEALLTEPNAIQFVNETYKHSKAIGAEGEGKSFLKETSVKEVELKKLNGEEVGVLTDGNIEKFIKAIANHRFWNREEMRKVHH
jgi:catalase